MKTLILVKLTFNEAKEAGQGNSELFGATLGPNEALGVTAKYVRILAAPVTLHTKEGRGRGAA